MLQIILLGKHCDCKEQQLPCRARHSHRLLSFKLSHSHIPNIYKWTEVFCQWLLEPDWSTAITDGVVHKTWLQTAWYTINDYRRHGTQNVITDGMVHKTWLQTALYTIHDYRRHGIQNMITDSMVHKTWLQTA